MLQFLSPLARRGHVLAAVAIVATSFLVFLFYLQPEYLRPGLKLLPKLHAAKPPAPVSNDPPSPSSSSLPPTQPPNTQDLHPIEELIHRAEARLALILSARVSSLSTASAAYRNRRGRHPPPGYDAWFSYATARNAVIVESFFDQIYDDLEPFWGVPARQVRGEAAKLHPSVISIRRGKVEVRQPEGHDHPWMKLWPDMIGTIAKDLPDMDIPINTLDESRLLVPWEDVDKAITTAHGERKMGSPEVVMGNYSRLGNVTIMEVSPVNWVNQSSQIWPLVRGACPPESPARTLNFSIADSLDLSVPAPSLIPMAFPAGSYEGFVSNWTVASDPCLHPHLRGLHGTFIEPLTIRSSTRLVPLFGGSKLSVNNEILLPPAMDWSDMELYTGGDFHGGPWQEKKNKVIWRGVASGGENKEATWTYFQRHRFVAMLNGTTIFLAEEDPGRESLTFKLAPASLYNVPQQQQPGKLSEWISDTADASFTDLLCFPVDPQERPHCHYTDAYYNTVPHLPMKEQYSWKYLPDIDGNSFSGRFRGFLRSTSLPIKATVYREWHNSRLSPWVHFVPMDNTFIDLYAIMSYFLTTGDRGDGVARRIAEEGQEWAEKVLRKEDMQIYVYRLLLEWARICDDNRLKLGFVGDIK